MTILTDDNKAKLADWALKQGPWMVLACVLMFYAIPEHLKEIRGGYTELTVRYEASIEAITAAQSKRLDEIVGAFEREQAESRRAYTALIEEVRRGLEARRVAAEKKDTQT